MVSGASDSIRGLMISGEALVRVGGERERERECECSSVLFSVVVFLEQFIRGCMLGVL